MRSDRCAGCSSSRARATIRASKGRVPAWLPTTSAGPLDGTRPSPWASTRHQCRHSGRRSGASTCSTRSVVPELVHLVLSQHPSPQGNSSASSAHASTGSSGSQVRLVPRGLVRGGVDNRRLRFSGRAPPDSGAPGPPDEPGAPDPPGELRRSGISGSGPGVPRSSWRRWTAQRPSGPAGLRAGRPSWCGPGSARGWGHLVGWEPRGTSRAIRSAARRRRPRALALQAGPPAPRRTSLRRRVAAKSPNACRELHLGVKPSCSRAAEVGDAAVLEEPDLLGESTVRSTSSATRLTSGSGIGRGRLASDPDGLAEQHHPVPGDVEGAVGGRAQDGPQQHLGRVLLVQELQARVEPEHRRACRQLEVTGQRVDVRPDLVGQPQHGDGDVGAAPLERARCSPRPRWRPCRSRAAGSRAACPRSTPPGRQAPYTAVVDFSTSRRRSGAW